MTPGKFQEKVPQSKENKNCKLVVFREEKEGLTERGIWAVLGDFKCSIS